MIEGLLLNSGRNTPILAPTPIKLQKHMITSMATPSMISSTSYSSKFSSLVQLIVCSLLNMSVHSALYLKK